jgi:hypothetical protein
VYLILNQPLQLLNGVSLASVADALLGAGAWLWNHIHTGLGDLGATAAVALAAVVGFWLVYKLVELLLAIIKYLVIPALILAVLATIVLHVPFFTALPVCALGCSLVLVFKS